MKKTIVRIILVTLLGLASATRGLADGGSEPVPLCYPPALGSEIELCVVFIDERVRYAV